MDRQNEYRDAPVHRWIVPSLMSTNPHTSFAASTLPTNYNVPKSCDKFSVQVAMNHFNALCQWH